MGLMSCSAYKIEVSNGYYTPVERRSASWRKHWFSFTTEKEARNYIEHLRTEARIRRAAGNKRYIKIK